MFSQLQRGILSGVVAAGLLLGGCASLATDKAPVASQLVSLKDGIRLDLQADEQLNFFNNQSHTLVLVVYQLSDPAYVQQLASTVDGIGELLESRPNDVSVVARRKLLIQPGENKQVYIDRASEGNYIALLAGFFTDDVHSVYRVLHTDIRERNIFFWRPSDSDPSDTMIGVKLGAEKIVGVSVNGRATDKVM